MSKPDTYATTDTSDARVLSHLAVRRLLGVLGLALPVLLYAHARTVGAMQPSISDFYHTAMGDILVGILCAIGVFLISYKGYPRADGETLSDQWVATAAGLGAIGVALFPVAPPGGATCPAGQISGLTFHWCGWVWLHFASAALFFVCLALFALVLFPKGHRHPDGRVDWTVRENRIYLACGLAIVLSLLALGVYAVLKFTGSSGEAALNSVNYVFWWETVGVIAFGISWLVKGATLKGVQALIRRIT